MIRPLMFAIGMLSAACLTLSPLSAAQDKSFDVQMHVGKDADAAKQGLPLYPGARPRHEENNDPVNFGLLTGAFGLKLIVAKYESDDAPGKIIDFYRGKLKKFGKVLECHAQKEGTADVHRDDDAKDDGPLKCEQDSGPVTELKVGTKDNQHVVAVEPSGNGATFSLVYVYTRGKQGDL